MLLRTLIMSLFIACSCYAMEKENTKRTTKKEDIFEPRGQKRITKLMHWLSDIIVRARLRKNNNYYALEKEKKKPGG